MHDVVVIKTTQHMNNGIGFPDVGQKLIAQAFAFTGAFYQSCDIDDFYRSRYHFFGINQCFQPI